MTTQSDMDGSQTRRRSTIALPKRRYHVAMAVIVLATFISTPVFLSERFGSETDAEARGSVEIAQLANEHRPTPLDASAAELPDLLASVVPVGDNPTAVVDTSESEPATRRETTRQPASSGRAVIIRPPEPVVPPLDPSLVRQTPAGSVPGPNGSGLTPLQAYAAERVPTAGKSPVSIIVGGLGINPDLTRRAIQELPASVTLSFAAQAEGLQDWINQARAFGHEVLLEVPMEGQNSGPSEISLQSNLPAEINRRRLHQTLTKAQGYIGLTHYQGDVFLSRSNAVQPILDEIKASGLAFFTDGSFDTVSLGATAQSMKLPYKSAFGLIDPVASEKVVEARLNGLAKAAEARPGLIGVGFVYPETIDAVRRWTRTLENDVLILVPASQTLIP